MLFVYPDEWRKYMFKGKVYTFRADTPKDIVDKAKALNETRIANVGEPIFSFEVEEKKKKALCTGRVLFSSPNNTRRM